MVDVINSGAGHVPLSPRKSDDADGGGDSSGYGAGDKLLPEVPSGFDGVGLSGNYTSTNGADTL